MNEAKLVPAPTSFPARCLLCPSQKGPILDTGIDTPFPGPNASGAVYICRSCARQISAIFGFAEGEKLQQLENAAEERDRYEAQLAASEGQTRKMSAAFTESEQQIRVLQAQLDEARNANHQQRFLTQQIVELGNQLMVGANGNG